MNGLQPYSLIALNSFTSKFLNEIINSKDYTSETKQLAKRVLNTRK